jgi:N-acetylglucosaminyldiphosphoundecaprenol N-acetyl-beta-D-mannosaminyltransferase
MATQVHLFGNRVDAFSPEEALDNLMERLRRSDRGRVYFVNAHCLNIASQDAAYREALADAEVVLADGSGLLIGSRILGLPIRHNLNGTDLVPRLLERAGAENRRVFLLGARPGVSAEVAQVLRKRYPGLIVSGYQHGFLTPELEHETLEMIAAAKPDILLVAMGVPLQEEWLRENWEQLPVTLGIATGALFDFLSGRYPRAPRWMRRVGLEWCFRLIQEPRRLWRRYLIGNAVFMAHVLAVRRRPAVPTR